VNLHQFLLALRGRFWVFATLAATTAVVAILVTLILPKSYDASTSLLLDYRDEQSLAGTVPSARERTGYMQTQMDIITSQRVASRVAQELELNTSPQVQAAYAKAGAKGPIEEWVGAGLLQNLKVSSSQSSVIQLTYRAEDPEFAARAANAFAKAYQDTTLALRVAPTKQATGWFDEQLKSLRSDLETAQNKLAAFQKEKGIIVTDERMDIEASRLTELNNQLLRANDASYEAQSRSGLASGGTARADLPEVLGNPVIQAIKAELMRAEAALSETSTRLGPNHPQYQQQASQVANLRGRLGAEMNRVVSGVQNVTAQTRARSQQLQAAVEAQRQKVIEMRDAKNAAFILARDVDTAQKAYEAAQQRYTVNKVESGARYSNVTVLNEATPPAAPARPKFLLNLVLGVVLGLVLGFAAVFLLELLDRRVRSTDDLESGLDAPVIGQLQTWNPSRLLGGNGGAHRALPSPA
jgi:polysaccharide biosynthesis transport protein